MNVKLMTRLTRWGQVSVALFGYSFLTTSAAACTLTPLTFQSKFEVKASTSATPQKLAQATKKLKANKSALLNKASKPELNQRESLASLPLFQPISSVKRNQRGGV